MTAFSGTAPQPPLQEGPDPGPTGALSEQDPGQVLVRRLSTLAAC